MEITYVKAAAMLAVVMVASGAGAGQTRPPITGISHVGLDEDNPEAVQQFYDVTLGWPMTKGYEQPGAVRFQVNSQQYVEVFPTGGNQQQPEMDHIAYSTTDAAALLRYLKKSGVTVPSTVTRDPDGAQRFMVHDPEGNKVEFVQSADKGKPVAAAADEVSTQLIHVGLATRDPVVQDHFYKDILGFRLFWTGWANTGHPDWIDMQVPEGSAWIEYMLNTAPDAPRSKLASADHFSGGVVNIDAAVKLLAAHGLQLPPRKGYGPMRDGKHKQNLFDPGGTRVELMEFKPVQEPCCTPYTGNVFTGAEVDERKTP